MNDVSWESDDEASPSDPFIEGTSIQNPASPEPTFDFLSWRDVSVTVYNRQQGGWRTTYDSREILHSVSGYVCAGQSIAIIGASGSGKTTLLNVLSGRRRPTKGDVLFNGTPLRDVVSLSRRMAYVMQEDIHLPNLTCQEALEYAALLRLRDATQKQKLKRVAQLIRRLDLQTCANTRIGKSGGAGLSGGERKRLSIAMELVQGAELLLLDEPTSGLDSFTAESVVNILGGLAAAGTTVVTTIHQPGSDMFALFQQLLVMGNGHIVYQGQAAEAVDYFGGFGYQCPQYCNPADYIMRILRSSSGTASKSGDLVEDLAMAHSRQFIMPDAFIATPALFDDLPISYGAGPCLQFRVLCWRALTNVRRDPYLTYARTAQTIFLSLMAGAIFWQLPNDFRGINSKAGALFFILFNQTIAPLVGIIHTFPDEKTLVFREQRSGMYRLSIYYMSKILVEWPAQMVFPCVFIAILYYMCGFNPDPQRFLVLVAIAVAVASIGQGLGLLASVCSDSLAVTLAAIPVLLMPFAILSGFIVQTVPAWLKWLSRISFYRMAFENAIVNQFQGLSLPPCPPLVPRYLCPRTDADVFQLLNINSDQDNIWKNWAVLIAYSVILRILAFIVLWIRTRRKATE